MADSSSWAGMVVEGADGVGDLQGAQVVAPGVVGAVAAVGRDQEPEQLGGGVQEAAAAGQQPHAARSAEGVATRATVARRSPNTSASAPELVVGVPPVGVDEGGGQVEQAASMSTPRFRRTVARTPAASSSAAKSRSRRIDGARPE